MHTTLLKIQ